jgi:arylsulfatase A-like enzyme
MHNNRIRSVVNHLKEINEYDNTIIVFLADNGKYPSTAHNKGSSSSPFSSGARDHFYEGDIRVPAFISGGYVEKSLFAAGTEPYRWK